MLTALRATRKNNIMFIGQISQLKVQQPEDMHQFGNLLDARRESGCLVLPFLLGVLLLLEGPVGLVFYEVVEVRTLDLHRSSKLYTWYLSAP